MRLWKSKTGVFSKSRAKAQNFAKFSQSRLERLAAMIRQGGLTNTLRTFVNFRVFARKSPVAVAMFLVVGAMCLGESGQDVWGPDVRRVGVRLACLCKTCVETVGTCPMLQCHYSSPARQRIQQMAKLGISDDQMVAVFVKENGIQALSVPPTEGFNAMVWIMPWAAAALGLGAIAWYVKRHSKPAPVDVLPAGAMEKFHTQLDDFEKDMADHD